MLPLIAVFLTALAVAQCQSVEMPVVRLEIANANHVVYPDSTVHFICHLTGFDHSVVVNFEKEVLIGVPVKSIRETLSQSEILTEVYRENPRFSVERHTVDNELQYTLKIAGTKLEDSGYYSCGAFHREHGQQSDRKLFEVYRPPQAEVNLNGTYEIKEGELLPLECISRAALPIPEMEMWITDSDRPDVGHHGQGQGVSMPKDPRSDLTPTPYNESKLIEFISRWRNITSERWRHVTNEFLLATELKPHCDELPGLKTNCPLHFDYDVTMTRSEFRPDFRHDDKLITCFVSMRHMSRDTANASVLLNVRYKPKIRCDGLIPGKSVVKMNSSTHEIACKVFSNPPLADSDDRSWTADACSQPANPIPSGSSEYKADEKWISANKKSRTLSLQWKTPVTAEYYKKRYCLRVRNEIDETQLEIQLIESIDDIAAGSKQTSNLMMFLATAILVAISLMLNIYN